MQQPNVWNRVPKDHLGGCSTTGFISSEDNQFATSHLDLVPGISHNQQLMRLSFSDIWNTQITLNDVLLWFHSVNAQLLCVSCPQWGNYGSIIPSIYHVPTVQSLQPNLEELTQK